MCGRFALFTEAADIAEAFGIDREEIEPLPMGSFNRAPGQPTPVITANGTRRLQAFTWGIPGRGASGSFLMINIRRETLVEKQRFVRLLDGSRCLVVADGFYEWKKQSRRKEPYFFHLTGGGLMAFAGVFNHTGECAIITTPPNDLVERVHDRMPAILNPGACDAWLNHETHDPGSLLAPFPAGVMASHRVAGAVGNPRNDHSGLIEPVEPENYALL